MNNYVIRVYRRHPVDTDQVAGVIENTTTSRQKSFIDLSGLHDALEDFIRTDSFDSTDATQIDMYGYEEAVASG